MGKFIVRLFAVIGLIAVLLIAGVITLGGLVFDRFSAPPAPDRMVLELDLRQGAPDQAPPGRLTRRLTDGTDTLGEVTRALDRAAEDERVVAVVARFGPDSFGPAVAQELREAVGRFRESGKPAIAYAESFGELAPGNWSYLAASAFDEVRLQPGGGVGLTGVVSEAPFAADLLADLGIEVEVFRREDYKTAPNTVTETGYTEAQREMTESLVGDFADQLVAGIAEGRGLDRTAVERLMNDGPLPADRAIDGGLIDGLIHWRDLLAEVRAGAGEGPEPEGLGAAAYLSATGPVEAPDGRIAVIWATGMITEGESERPGFGLGPSVMGADTVSRSIVEAIESDRWDAIVLRIVSGGGSATASEVIRDAVREAAEAGKPLIVSMGSAAASGGYWIAADAAAIVAQPGTLTGSIGVFAGKPVLEDLWEDLGVEWDRVTEGRNAGMFSINRPYTAAQRARLQAAIDSIYQRFLTVVAEGRDLDVARVREIAGGRVWTGAQAREIGLVDRLGGLGTAVA
ncbi:MAG: signal peptide peptidase SppA, partial [Alphaproteobacteria bacterium]|nr:signal peptide peptidase SppA [Alphaproteobacteria bacterium]